MLIFGGKKGKKKKKKKKNVFKYSNTFQLSFYKDDFKYIPFPREAA